VYAAGALIHSASASKSDTFDHCAAAVHAARVKRRQDAEYAYMPAAMSATEDADLRRLGVRAGERQQPTSLCTSRS
jgi:hypothetical protein